MTALTSRYAFKKCAGPIIGTIAGGLATYFGQNGFFGVIVGLGTGSVIHHRLNSGFTHSEPTQPPSQSERHHAHS